MLAGCHSPILPNFAVIHTYIPLIGIPANVEKEGSLIKYARCHVTDVQARARLAFYFVIGFIFVWNDILSLSRTIRIIVGNKISELY